MESRSKWDTYYVLIRIEFTTDVPLALGTWMGTKVWHSIISPSSQGYNTISPLRYITCSIFLDCFINFTNVHFNAIWRKRQSVNQTEHPEKSTNRNVVQKLMLCGSSFVREQSLIQQWTRSQQNHSGQGSSALRFMQPAASRWKKQKKYDFYF